MSRVSLDSPSDATVDLADGASGYVNVGVRVRPLELPGSIRGKRAANLGIDKAACEVRVGMKDGGGKAFRYAHIFDDETNEQVFEQVRRAIGPLPPHRTHAPSVNSSAGTRARPHAAPRPLPSPAQVGVPLVDAALAGYNGTLMAYGQTGSGKTYTIGEIDRMGGKNEGVAHRVVRHLYASLDADETIAQCEVHIQFVQVRPRGKTSASTWPDVRLERSAPSRHPASPRPCHL